MRGTPAPPDSADPGSRCVDSCPSACAGNAYKIRDSAARAIELDGNEAVPHHVLARWCYEVAGVSWVVRRLAATIFGEPPTSSYEEALQHFEAADRLTQGQPWKENLFFMAKTLDKLGRLADAHRVRGGRA